MSAIGQFILDALGDPKQWTFDRYHATHASGVVLWIASGWREPERYSTA